MNRIAALAAFVLFSAASAWGDVVIERSSTATFTIPDAMGMRSVKNTQGPFFSYWQTSQRKAGNRILAMMVPLEDAAAINRGGFPNPSQYALAYTVIETEPTEITAAMFSRVRDPIFVAQIEKSDGPSPAPGDAAFEARLASYLREPGKKPVPLLRDGDPDTEMFLGVNARGDNYVVYGKLLRTASKVNGKIEESTLVMMTALMSVRDHMLNLQSFRTVRGRADIDAAKATMLDWVTKVTKANSQ
ncbi:hypothetical protein BWI17_07250 [Betaproteobacteria bacterium GR16-43]|nr:hypothetical protein BWI17_07250 [Betaproteobacteria bacterium GR16-43]